MNSSEYKGAGIHTILFSYKNTPESAKKLRLEIEEYSRINKCKFIPSKDNQNDKSKPSRQSLTLYLHQKGINIHLVKTTDCSKSNKFRNYFIQYEINPIQIIGSRHSIEICLESNFEYVCNRINDIISSINKSLNSIFLPYMQDMKLVRIDLCANVKFDVSQFDDPDTIVNMYIYLLKKYGAYKSFKLIKPSKDDNYNEEASVELEKSDITLYIYNKHTQMKDKPNVYNPDEIEDSFGLLRIELRLHNSKIYNDKKHIEISDNLEFLNKSVIDSQNNIEIYLRKLFFTGDYWSYTRAVQMIEDNTKLKSKTKENLCKLLFYIKKNDGVNSGIIRLMNDFKAEQNFDYNQKNIERRITDLLDTLDALNINPLTLSRSSDISYLPNLLKLIRPDEE